MKQLLPDRSAADPAQPIYLDRTARETPIIALGGAAREALRLADVLEQMLHGAHDALAQRQPQADGETRNRDDVLDGLNTAIKRYLTSFDPETSSEDDQRRLNEILAFTMNIEQAGDVIDRNLLPHASKRLKRGADAGPEGDTELAESDGPAGRQPSHRGVTVHDRRCARRPSAGGGKGDLPPSRARGRGRAFRCLRAGPGAARHAERTSTSICCAT